MAEDELTFLKAVFEEYKDSSGELEAELDAQLKDLERSNMALKRENEQIRAQLQATVMRSRKSAEEASNLTTALEAHLEELTKREKKAQSRIRLLEQENEQLKKDLESGGGGGGGGAPAAAPTMSAEAVAQAKAHAKALGEIKQLVFDSRVKMAKLATVTEHRFASSPMEHPIPDLPPEDTDDAEAIMEDMGKLSALLDKTAGIMAETGLTTVLVGQVSEMLNDPEHARTIGLSGQSEEAINKSCLVILGRLMILGETLPEFKRAVTTLKSSLKDHLAVEATEEGTSQLAHTILMLAQDIMKSVFDPMRESEKEDELKKMKNDTLAVIARAREEGEAKARQEAEDRIARERATADQSIEQTRAEIARLKAESEEQLASARTEAKQLAEKARREALEEAAVERGKLEEEIYQSVAGEMDALREALEKSEGQYKQAAMKQQMYQNSMKNAVLDQSKAMLGAMKNARTELETLRRGTQKELAETQKMLNENLNHVRKVARTIAKTDIAQVC
jgi:DNA repair exonuclease SbcCD ATPase subunit